MSQHLSTLYRWLFWLFLIFISYKFLTPSAHSGIEIPHLDKIVHAGIFFVLALLINKAHTTSQKTQLLWFGIYGALIEVLQGLSGYRSADIFDWLADMLGVLLFFALVRIWPNLATQEKRKAKRDV